jgi:NAD(P)-dependent dehydrogenase (short-subunit alcohol dehydrogenase family)
MSTRNLEGKTALVTGASRGLGKAIALALAGAGARLILVSRDRALLDQTSASVRACGSEAMSFETDVTDEKQVLELEAAVKREFGKLQILVNNAG